VLAKPDLIRLMVMHNTLKNLLFHLIILYFRCFQGGWGPLNNSISYQQDIWAPSPPPTPQGKKAWCHVELGWLQALRAKLKQREDQCFALQRALQQKERETEKIFSGIAISQILNNRCI
jgi:hypothetical protein